MDIQLGIWNLNWSHFTFEEGLAGIRASGFDLVALYPVHSDGPCYTEDFTDEQVDALKKRLDDCGLTCCMLMAVKPTGENLDACKRRIDMAARMGVKQLCVTGTWEWVKFLEERKSDEVLKKEHQEYVAATIPTARYAEQVGVTICLKPHGGNSATGPLLKQTIDDVGSPAFQACLDLGNVRFYEGIDPVADIEPVLAHAKMICLKDHSGGRGNANFPIIGDGGVDHPALFERLNATGFDGPAVIERYDGAAGRTGITFRTVCERAMVSRANVLRIAATIG